MLLTLKDFSLLNLPCFVCQNLPLTSLVLSDCSSVYPHKSHDLFVFTLKVSYSSSLSLYINPVHNSLSLASPLLPNLLSNSSFLSSCQTCSMTILSNHLSFDFNKNLLLPISLHSQSLILQDPSLPIQYKIFSDFNHNSSTLFFLNSNRPPLSLPLSPSFIFKNKSSLINKIKKLTPFL